MGVDDLQAAGITQNILGGDSRRKPNQHGLKPGVREERLDALEEFREKIKELVEGDEPLFVSQDVLEQFQELVATVEPPVYTGE